MGEFPNKATQFKKGDKAVVESGRKGGSANKNNPNAQRAARLRGIKRSLQMEKTPPERIRKIIDMVENKDVFDVDLLNYFYDIKNSVHPSQRVALLNVGNTLRKTMHGDSKQNTFNIQVNILDEDKIKSTIQRLLLEGAKEDEEENKKDN